MSSKKILTIKDWHGTGKGDLKLEIVDYRIERLRYANGVFDRLTIQRKPDRYSSRLGMMATLNKNRGKLSWGFSAMIINDDEFSKNGSPIVRQDFHFSGGAVENSSMAGKLEVVSFVGSQIGWSCDGKCYP